MSARLQHKASLPDRLTPQLATLVSAPPSAGQWTYEIKFDGYRILARCERGSVRLLTRNGNDWTAKMPRLAQEMASIPVESAWFDGEIVVLREDGLPDFNALQRFRQASDSAANLLHIRRVIRGRRRPSGRGFAHAPKGVGRDHGPPRPVPRSAQSYVHGGRRKRAGVCLQNGIRGHCRKAPRFPLHRKP